jgi:galactose oxidase
MVPCGSLLRARVLPLLVATVPLLSLACSDDRSEPGPHPDDTNPLPTNVGEDAPINLAYVCGNRFIVSNAYRVPVGVTWRVVGTAEEGTAELEAAPDYEPAESEVMIETRARGTVQVYFQGKPVVARLNEGASCGTAGAVSAAVTSADASQSGEWTAPFPWPIIAVHMALLPNGKVLSVGRKGVPQVWDPATGAFTASPSPAWLFCAGHAVLADGRVLFVGGHISNNHGLPNITIFDASGGWSSSAQMARGRWYPTATTMGNGDVVILAGRDQGGVDVPVPEVWSNGSVHQLTGASYVWPYYPRSFLAPDGRLFVAGAPAASRWLTVTGVGAYKAGPKRLGGARNYGSAVMYDEGKILYAGGAYTTNTAEVIDLINDPVWHWTDPMANARRHLNLTVLPTGEVLATGGVAGTTFNDVTKGVHAAEVWNPTSGHWTTLASSAITRGYHASSLLLPDGRVLHSGGGDGAGAPQQNNAEIFSPPYLFRGSRPTITTGPDQVAYSTHFRIETPDAAEITHVSLIRTGAVTHAFDENQRFQHLTFTADASGLTVNAPTLPNRAPPGYYLLFILNGSDVPSVGKFVRLN